MTPDQVAQILQVHPFTVLKFIKQGKLKASKLGRVYRIREGDLENFLELSSSRSSKTPESEDKDIYKSKNKNKNPLKNKKASPPKNNEETTVPTENPENTETELSDGRDSVQISKVDTVESSEGETNRGGADEYYILQ